MSLLLFEMSLPDPQAVSTPERGISARSGKYLRHHTASPMALHLLIKEIHSSANYSSEEYQHAINMNRLGISDI